MDYELYHDESLEGGYWHGMLLVPASNKSEFLDLLLRARSNTRYSEKIGIKKVDRKGPIYNCASAWTQIGTACLRSSAKGKAEPVFLGLQEKGKLQYEPLGAYGMKFILFRERDAHKQLTGFSDHASKIETTFALASKAGCTFLVPMKTRSILRKSILTGINTISAILIKIESSKSWLVYESIVRFRNVRI